MLHFMGQALPPSLIQNSAHHHSHSDYLLWLWDESLRALIIFVLYLLHLTVRQYLLSHFFFISLELCCPHTNALCQPSSEERRQI